jgi:phosphate/sulfate permease
MENLFLLMVGLLLLLAVFDLSVGVSNDAVNFLTSAVGSKAAPLRRILLVAAAGVFVGAIMSNGMMEIARHGIFRPEHFTFYELMCIFMAVMVTDILLLDLFNSLGLPTSTTVSMVFELLGATFAIALVKLAHTQGTLALSDLLNTEKALSVILGIFLSVAIAFVFGTVVQFLTRLLFTFRYTRHLPWKIGLFGGVATTAIVYFLLIKGVKDMSFMTPEVKQWIAAHTLQLMAGCWIVLTLLMQLLHLCRVNVFKVIVLTGTFALSMAFAGNDLVNFIGVPLTGYAAYQDYTLHGAGHPHSYLMGALNAPANTPVPFLLMAGVVMVVSLSTSRKARNVIKTEVGLGSQNAGEEMFGSSRLARRLVRSVLSIVTRLQVVTPQRWRLWLRGRFNTQDVILENGAAFDLVRGCVNLTLAGMLIALGTSLKLPLSTTYVTFMVAMGTSLADRAWGRESAVFRITGVISVIGGWFVTAGAAFLGAAAVVTAMYHVGEGGTLLIAAVAVALLVRSNLRYREKEERVNELWQALLAERDKRRVWGLLQRYLSQQQTGFLRYVLERYRDVVGGFLREDAKVLARSERSIADEKMRLKSIRRRETLCLQRVDRRIALEHNAWFYVANNCCMSMLYNLRRINENCKEHVENNFRPLPTAYVRSFDKLYESIFALLDRAALTIERPEVFSYEELRTGCDSLKERIGRECKRVYDDIRQGDADVVAVSYVYLNLLQESREMVSMLRKLLRASQRLQGGATPVRSEDPS